MRSFRLLPWLLLSAACATAPFDRAALVATDGDALVKIEDVAADLARADVVAFGEHHRTPPVHAMHLALLEELHRLRPNLVVAMEMFERDVQSRVLLYLQGVIDEAEFERSARPWPRYAEDYRPVVEFCKQHGLMLLAANAPQPLVTKARQQGLASVAGQLHVAREVSVPEDEGWDAFRAAGHGHGAESEGAMKAYWEAQCLRDDTMAEAITDYLGERRAVGDRPLVVLICGRHHSDHRRGVVQRVLGRMSELEVRVLSVEEVDDVRAGVYTSPRRMADYVVVVPKGSSAAPVRLALPVAKAAEDAPAAPAPAAPVPAPAANPEGVQPALGLLPDYTTAVDGVRVEAVRPGGAAEAAGIEPGDVIIALAGEPVEDVAAYTELLGRQRIGAKVAVRVRRGEAAVDLQVLVTSRSR
jgi:uncharacterized iron-regulated protein